MGGRAEQSWKPEKQQQGPRLSQRFPQKQKEPVPVIIQLELNKKKVDQSVISLSDSPAWPGLAARAWLSPARFGWTMCGLSWCFS